MDLGASGTSASMLELDEGHSSKTIGEKIEFTTSTMPKKRHFYTNAAPAKVEGNVFRYDFDDKVNKSMCLYFNSFIQILKKKNTNYSKIFQNNFSISENPKNKMLFEIDSKLLRIIYSKRTLQWLIES